MFRHEFHNSGVASPLLPGCPARAGSGGTLFRPSTKEVVMRTVLTFVALVVGISAYAAWAAADDEKADQKAGAVLEERIQVLNLTDEQETKIADIQKECGPKVEEAAKELSGLVKEEMEKIHPVLTAEQREKLQAMREERKEHRAGGLVAKLAHLKELHLTEGEMSQIHQIRTEFRPKIAKAMEGFKGILNDEQRKTREEGLAAKLAHLKELDLTDAEMSQIQQIRNEFRPKIAKAMEGFKGILNDEQRKSREQSLLAGKKRREVLESLNLTAAQKEKAEEVGKEVRTTVREEMEKIRDVLSAEQQAKLVELKDERHDRARDRLASAIVNSRELNLSDEQKASIAKIRAEFRPKIHETGTKLRAAARNEMEMILAVIKGT